MNQLVLLLVTLDTSWVQIPTRSHKPTIYRPKFHPLWSPDIGLNPTTSDLSFHIPSFTSIQWAVIPKNDAFVVSALHPSAVREIFPGAPLNSLSKSHGHCLKKLTNISLFLFFNHFTNWLWIYVVTLWVLGISLRTAFGFIATKQFRNRSFPATAKAFKFSHHQRTVHCPMCPTGLRRIPPDSGRLVTWTFLVWQGPNWHFLSGGVRRNQVY